MWRLGIREPLWHLTWDWWWWLVMFDDPDGEEWGKQLMVLWSTKDNDRVEVNGTPWTPSGRPGFDEHGGMLIDGMVCAWWFDGQRMHEPYIKRTCDMIAMDDAHPAWPQKGAVPEAVPLYRFCPTTYRWVFTATSVRSG